MGLHEHLPRFRRMAGWRLVEAAEGPVSRSSYGRLVPPEGGQRPAVEVDAETALLWLTLDEPRPLPAYFTMTGTTVDALRRAGAVEEVATPGRLVSLSLAAMAAALESGRGEAGMARMLYLANTAPAARGLPALPSAAHTLRHLGLTGGAETLALARAAGWVGPWLSPGWIHLGRPGTPAPSGPTPKLYVSARLEVLPTILPTILRVLAGHPCRQLKLGADLAGLLRPDKLVAYLTSIDDLLTAAHDVAMALADVPAQGAPFTVGVDRAGLVSWGVDPAPVGREPPTSWRAWISGRIAHHLARTDSVAEARAALGQDGVDPRTFAPMAGFGHGPAHVPAQLQAHASIQFPALQAR